MYLSQALPQDKNGVVSPWTESRNGDCAAVLTSLLQTAPDQPSAGRGGIESGTGLLRRAERYRGAGSLLERTSRWCSSDIKVPGRERKLDRSGCCQFCSLLEQLVDGCSGVSWSVTCPVVADFVALSRNFSSTPVPKLALDDLSMADAVTAVHLLLHLGAHLSRKCR